MKLKNIFLSSAFMMAGCVTLSAQEEVKTEYTFNPHWYVQGQFGAQHTLGEVDFGKLISPNAQIGVGYNFSSIWGARLSVNAWQSKAGSVIHYNQYQTVPNSSNLVPVAMSSEYKWKWNYIAPTLDLTINLSNLVLGYNPERKFDFGTFIGIGGNFAFKNDEAKDANQAMNELCNTTQALPYLWEDNKALLVGRVGVNADYHINDAWSVGLELQANFCGDHYNSKRAHNSDWYFNGLAGVKYNFGKTYTKTTRPAVEQQPCVPCPPQIVEKTIEKVVDGGKAADELRRDIFFTIRNSKIDNDEMRKVEDIVFYMMQNPNAKVEVTGYADKGTGNASINQTLSEKRAQVVVDTLVNQYGIESSRIISSSKGDTEQPYAKNDLNRVSICVVK